MKYVIKDSEGNVLNTILADSEFIEEYCNDNNYTYEEIAEPPVSPPEPSEPSDPETPENPTDSVTWEAMAKAITEGVNEV